VIIYSKTIEEHIEHIKEVMLKLKEADFKISGAKSNWFMSSVKFLGYIVSGSNIAIDPKKTATIRDRPSPKNVKQLQQALGSFNWLRTFIPNFAHAAKPLYALITAETWHWTKEHEEAYRLLINNITTAPALAQPILGKPFTVYTDGSTQAIGGVLTQIIDGKEHIIEYWSRLLKGAELNYGITDIECLAAISAIRHWHYYLYGVHFTLYTDHIAILNIMTLKVHPRRRKLCS
jgi:hypothetical protein